MTLMTKFSVRAMRSIPIFRAVPQREAGASWAGLSLAGLALCVLAIGTGEYVVAGMLPALAAGLGVGVPVAGQLVTVYAATVMLAGPALTAVTARRAPKGLLLALMGVFVAGTLGCSVAPSYGVMLTARVVAALAHCTVFAVAAVVATSLVPPQQVAKAIAAVAAGLTLATVLGVPLGTVVAAQLGWRWTFTVVAAVGAAGVGWLAAVLPRQPVRRPAAIDEQVQVLLRPAVAVTFMLTIFSYAGVFAGFTYLVPLAVEYAGAGPLAATVVVTAFGMGGMVGNALASRWTDAHPRRVVLASLCGLAASLLVLPTTIRSLPLLVGVVAVFGAAAFATIPGLQARVIGLAAGAPTLAVATNVAAFNLANTIGAAIGGLVAATAGLTWTAPVGGLITLGGLVLAAVVFHPHSALAPAGGNAKRKATRMAA